MCPYLAGCAYARIMPRPRFMTRLRSRTNGLMTMTTREEIGRLIRQAREELGLSQTELGRMMSRQRTHAAVSDLERGNVRLDVEELAELSRLLQKDLQYFYEGGSARGVVYRRGDYGLLPEQQRETDQAVEAFKQFAREQARRQASR